MESSLRKDDFLSDLDPKLIHRVLLTDEAGFHNLTVSGRSPSVTPSFDDFSRSLSSTSQDLSYVMKRAYRDHVRDFVLNKRDMGPLHKLLLDLYSTVRKLVPNRKDLHGILKNDDIGTASSPFEFLPLVVEAGKALQQLESEIRSETTREWISAAQEYDTSSGPKETISFVITSIMYLLLKVELCDADKKDFYLANVFAPMIHSQGSDYEKHLFETRYGRLNDDSTAPLTRMWIKELIGTQTEKSKANLLVSSEARKNFIGGGWVDDILFRSAAQPLKLPEVLANDDITLKKIREKTRMAAAGSALALHACTAAGVSAAVLNQPLEPASPIAMRREALVEAMTSRNPPSIAVYEETVASATMELAKEWNPSLSEGAADTLRGRAKSVLQGEDLVIKLLDDRMKEVFRGLVVWKPKNVPRELRSGIVGATKKTQKSDAARLFDDEAKKEFCRRGLSFFSSELADASYLARKTIELAWGTFGKDLLDRMIQNIIRDKLSI